MTNTPGKAANNNNHDNDSELEDEVHGLDVQRQKSHLDGNGSSRPNNHRTNRKVMVKLELTGNVMHQLDVVNRTLFETDERNNISFSTPATDSLHWPTVDDVLYSVPKATYDNIYKAFMSDPKVYKLESVKETVWKQAKEEIGNNFEAVLSTSWEIPSKKRKKKKKSGNDHTVDPQEETFKSYLDPFVDGEVEQVWKEKLEILEKLTPREDLSGYEYREDYFEQQYRIALQADFQGKMKREIHRRLHYPTLIEQVEDVLHTLVERVASTFDQEQEIKKNERREYLRSLRHPATREVKMKRLLKTETENGQLIEVVTDLDFGPMIVTDGHYIISPTIPNRVLYQHEQERRLMAEIQRRDFEEKEMIRRLPLTEKIRSAVALAKTDLKSASRQIMHDFIDKAVLLPTEPMREKFNTILHNGLRGLLNMGKDPEKTLNNIAESILDAYDVIVEGQKVVERKKKRKNADDFLAEARLMHNPPPEESKESTEIDLDKVVKNTIPDAVLVKLMMKVQPPPLYVRKPRKTLRTKLYSLVKQAKKAMRKGQLTLGDKMRLLLPNKERSYDDISYVAALRRLQFMDVDESGDDNEEIPLEDLLLSPSFDGFLKMDDLIISPKVISL
jgi:uncharacterized membrane protein